MLAIRLQQDIEDRLERLAKRTGRTKTFYAREAILDHLEDLEEGYLALSRQKHPKPPVSAKNAKRQLGI